MAFIKLTVLICVSLLISGCANKTVYLFNQGYTTTSINKISEQLIVLGYDVERIDAEIPAEFSDTAIATHPVFVRPNDLPIIENILKKSAFPTPNYYQFAQGNHFYSPKSIGLYLRNGYQKVMPPIMGDISCFVNDKPVDATLEFRRSGEVILELDIYSESEQLQDSFQQQTGKYILLDNSIQLDFTDFKTDYLPIKQIKVQTYAGEKNADQLVFQSHNNNSPIENCLFEAVYN